MRTDHQGGFTLIELMIGVALIAVLSALAVPAFSHWIQNAQIRTGAEGVLNGLQVARAEAVRRNNSVTFVMNADSGWTVSTVLNPAVIQTRDAGEGSANAKVVVTPAGATTVTFNALGWIAANADGSATISRVDVSSKTSTDPDIRPLRVVLTAGGSAKMCDPAVVVGDPRGCP